MTNQEIRLSQGSLRYRDEGEGPPVVFVHGLLVDSGLWRAVIPDVVAAGFRCLAPDWPLGAHRLPMNADADLTPPGVAKLIAEFLTELDLREVTVVANDTGGAITQILMANHPERVGRVVLTPSDTFEEFFPPLFSALPRLARVPGSMWLLTQAVRFKAVQRLPIAFGWVAKRPLPADVVDGFLRPSRENRLIRRDLGKLLRGVHRRHTLAAAREFPRFRKPVLLAWAREDRVFKLASAYRLAELLPDARVVEIEDSWTFVPQDQPAALVKHLVSFMAD
ncbi:alpha/beta fold hydrolase [Amycolatopsis sp. cg5]|uniref:alpha/beta fold hydrolase n=1 Tax=Amycolatopsis sp. cg5 TaxID=3238802 RepID=UPI0035251D2D